MFEGFFVSILSDILHFAQSDIFDKPKVLLKPVVLVVFYSPAICVFKYHCVAISLATQISLAVWRIKLQSILKETLQFGVVFLHKKPNSVYDNFNKKL